MCSPWPRVAAMVENGSIQTALSCMSGVQIVDEMVAYASSVTKYATKWNTPPVIAALRCGARPGEEGEGGEGSE